MRRLVASTLLGVLLTATATFAADDQAGATTAPASIAASAAAMASTTALAATAEQNAAFLRRFQAPQRPAALPVLYGTAIALQGYDAYSTLNALKQGGVEANPMMKGITKNPTAFIGLKVGVTALSIMASEKMWKNHNRMGAIVTMVATNSLMAMVAANNARVMGDLR